MTRFVPRPYQPSMTQFMLDHERSCCFSRMGSGKGASTLDAISQLLLFNEVKRVLVLGPHLVAKYTWPDEVRQFNESFGHMSIASAIGTPAQRTEIVKSKPQILCINYENVEWLVRGFGDLWPFDMVVADESGRISSHRVGQRTSVKGNEFFVSGGSVRAASLAKIAHKYVRRWINLNGSPAPNGVAPLWGQMWFIDGGKRLGRSFDGFTDKWFRSFTTESGYSKLEPLPYAQKEIEDAIRDVCLTVDPRPFLNTRALVEHNIFVHLPPKARKNYDEVQKDLFTMIREGKFVEAFNEGGKVNKCLAKGTEVLTSSGWKPIELCTKNDLVWDGESWVNHDGAVSNGTQSVVRCWSTMMTADHRVMTVSGWKTAQEVIDGESCRGLGRQSVRPPDYRYSRRNDTLEKRWASACHMERNLYLRKEACCDRSESSQSEQRPGKILWVLSWGTTYFRKRFSWTLEKSCTKALDEHAKQMLKAERFKLETLRWARDNYLQKMVELFAKLSRRYVPNMAKRVDVGADQKRQRVLAKELPMGHADRASKQSNGQRIHNNTERSYDRCASCANIQPDQRHDLCQTKEGQQRSRFNSTKICTAEVFDLTNCGPLHRFTVRGEDGIPFLSHNCLQLASFGAYTNTETREYEITHTEKLQALESIVSEAAGESLLIRYCFTPERDMILKAFPMFKPITAPNAMQDFQEGRLQGLVVHAASAGHGISLQKNCRILVDFSSSYNFGEDEQIIERIGPTRQAQSGFDRDVYRYRIIAKDTIEETAVLPALAGKMGVQESLLAAMQR